MLPSTGFFKGINCAFYDSGLCERPYCHFRHVKNDSQSTSNDGIESGAILQRLVSAAVQKVLQQTEASAAAAIPQVNPIDSIADASTASTIPSVPKATYNPTPIAELNKINNSDTENTEDVNDQKKRHIPVPYTPRKPASLSIKRNFDNDISSKPFVFIPPPLKYTPGSTESIQLDPYTPIGTNESKEKYTPGVETKLPEYTPDSNQILSKINYVPSDKGVHKKKVVLEYKPAKVATKKDVPSVTYQPTPRSLAPCFSSDEDEPDIKKPKLSNDLNGLDDLGAEFDILDQILDEEKPKDVKKKCQPDEITKKHSSKEHKENNNDKVCKKDKSSSKKTDDLGAEFDVLDQILDEEKPKEVKKKCQPDETTKKHSSKEHKENNNDKVCKKDKSSSNKTENGTSKSSKEKSKSEKKDKSTSHDKDKHVSKSKSSEKKSSHKSSSRDKEKDKEKIKDEKKEKHKDKERDNSKSRERSSKHSEKSSKHSVKSSKSSDKHSKSSSSSKSSSDRKSKDHKSHRSAKKSKDKREKSKHDNDSYNGLSDTENNHISDDLDLSLNNEETYDISDSDEESRALECKRIFEEYVPTKKIENNDDLENKVDENHDDEYVPSKKRISRTADKNIRVTSRPPIKPDFKLNAAQAMAERLVKIKEYHAAKNEIKTNNEQVMPKLDPVWGCSNASSSSKIRIAHVSYASTMMNVKKMIAPNQISAKQQPSTSSTVVQTVKKGVQRVAHMPNDKFIDRPGVLEPLASKIPANIRSTYLNMMIDQCLNIYLSAVDAYARAQHEELATSKKCSTVPIYKNSAVLTVSRLKKELVECNGVKKSGSDCTSLQKTPQTVSGNSGNAGSWSIESKNKRLVDLKEFNGAKFYSNIQKWVLNEEQLQSNGFPRIHPNGIKGRAKIYSQNKLKPPVGNIRVCSRCKKEFTIDKKGFAAIKEECIYHPNNKYRVRGEARYQCCSQDGMSDGCCVAPSHVYEYLDYDNLKGYVRTLPPETKSDDYGVYSLDCEMCYTTHGLDLTRVTVINSACKVIYETLVKPLHPIVDYNTRYSGITAEHMEEVKTTLLEVQATLLAMFSSKTILIGHSLESDFKALKLIHNTVIDTSVLFPHKMGPPYKRALRNLSSEYLRKIIQNSESGHDSAEDAMVCMELLHYKLKEDLKTR